MVLNALKWAYGLGVKHERRRIAAALRNEAQAGEKHMRALYAREYPLDKPSKEDARVERAVTERIQRLIDSLFTPEQEYQIGGSVLFPKGDE